MTKIITTRTKITNREVATMIRMRQDGATLEKIAYTVGRTVFSVFQKTKHVPHVNRHTGYVVVNKQNGKVLSTAQEYTSPAIENLMKKIGFNAKSVIRNYKHKAKV